MSLTVITAIIKLPLPTVNTPNKSAGLTYLVSLDNLLSLQSCILKEDLKESTEKSNNNDGYKL